jgi:hypothetical protein
MVVWGGYRSSIKPISPALKKRMIHGGSWKRGCPTPFEDLRYLRMTYRGFDGRDHSGEMVVHRSVAREVTRIFGELYRIGYPIHRMRLVDDYGGSDYRSIEADNTSAFNCRKEMRKTRWSPHAYGRAIDINPIENPYVFRDGHVSHTASKRFLRRKHGHRSIIVPGDPIIKIFARYGWRWHGNGRSIRNYQHFEKGAIAHSSSLLTKVKSLIIRTKKSAPKSVPKPSAARSDTSRSKAASHRPKPAAQSTPTRPKPKKPKKPNKPAPKPNEAIDVDSLFE